MTKEITKSFIIQQIQDKFKLREFDPAQFLFDETVIPVYDVNPHLGEWHIKEETVSITAAQAFEFFAVPDNEKWTLRAYYMLFLGAGAIKVSGVYIVRYPENESFYLDLLAAQDVSYIVNLPQPVILEPETLIKVLFDTYVSTQNFTMKIDVRVETIR